MISKSEFKQRRKSLMRAMKKHSVAVVASAGHPVRNHDTEHPFRQNSDFFYLTGFNEPESVIVLAPGRKQGEYLVFCREHDEKLAVWVGRNAGLDGARETYRADEAFPIAELPKVLPELLENRERVYFPIGADANLDGTVMSAVADIRRRSRTGVRAPHEFVLLGHLLHEMRLFKSADEVGVMRRAAEVSAAAHRQAMRSCRPNKYEYEIEAELRHSFIAQGLRFEAYPSIVAGGRNACVLHYTDNNQRLNDGELLLIDAGAECDNYAADITRTFPINGRFSEPQRQLYQLVLDAQLAAIDAVRPGNAWNQPHDTAVRVLTKGLIKLGLLEGKLNQLIKDEAYKTFYMHRTGHWLGMDVHDVGDYRKGDDWRTLEPGMVLTVEPGLYIAADCSEVDPKWRGIGIRIEDDVLVTPQGHDILTADAPKTIRDIEDWMQA
jgi:Xaa-Pro aminopeptidase